MIMAEIDGVMSESEGEGEERHYSNKKTKNLNYKLACDKIWG